MILIPRKNSGYPHNLGVYWLFSRMMISKLKPNQTVDIDVSTLGQTSALGIYRTCTKFTLRMLY